MNLEIEHAITLQLESNLDEISSILRKSGSNLCKLKLAISKFFLKNEILGKTKRRHVSEKKRFIERAVGMSWKHHKGEHRKNGEMFLVHPIQTGYLVNFMGCNLRTTLAGFFHDSLESNKGDEITIINGLCGEKEILSLVHTCTSFPDASMKHELSDNIERRIRKKLEKKTALSEKIILLSTRDTLKQAYGVRVADRITNLRTLDSLPDPASKIATIVDTENYVYRFAKEVDAIYQPQKSMLEYLRALVKRAKSQLDLESTK